MKVFAAIGVVLALGLGAVYLTMGESHDAHELAGPSLGPDHGPGDHQPGEQWTCEMHPEVVRNEPGVCPICNMDLIPADTEAAQDAPASAPGAVEAPPPGA